MCGIFFALSRDGETKLHNGLKALLDRRGPDHQTSIDRALEFSSSNLHLRQYATVLSLRGDISNPRADQEQRLCWNGECWTVDSMTVDGNDTQEVYSVLEKACNIADSREGARDAFMRALASIEGPFAFVFHDVAHNQVFFGRDRIGRRSLMISESASKIILSSVGFDDGATDDAWHELDSSSVHVIDLDDVACEQSWNLVRLAWSDYVAAVPFNLSVCDEKVKPLTINTLSVSELQDVLERSVQRRIDSRIRALESNEQQAAVAVLFSGGLDCSIIARLIHDEVPFGQPIDLLNVAFENPRIHSRHKNLSEACETCPDRNTGRQALQELQQLCPGRKWQFLPINVPYELTIAHRQQIVSLIKPHDTEMDLSIACALYFAARAQLNDAEGSYTSHARVLFSGLGADELFGGYQRHETAYKEASSQGLVQELKLDLERLGKRNLGRDDRVISHWSKEVRYPFLDESVVDWAKRAPHWEKCGFGMDHAECIELGAPKLALRLIARRLGFDKVAAEKKRAIQFGARTAKMEVGRSKGTDVLKQ